MKIKQADRLIPRTDVRTRRRNVTRLLVRHVSTYYGDEDPKDTVPWVTDELRSLARTLRKLTPRNGW